MLGFRKCRLRFFLCCCCFFCLILKFIFHFTETTMQSVCFVWCVASYRIMLYCVYCCKLECYHTVWSLFALLRIYCANCDFEIKRFPDKNRPEIFGFYCCYLVCRNRGAWGKGGRRRTFSLPTFQYVWIWKKKMLKFKSISLNG